MNLFSFLFTLVFFTSNLLQASILSNESHEIPAPNTLVRNSQPRDKTSPVHLARRVVRPRKKNLPPDVLKNLLGNYFNVRWMSIERPESMDTVNKEPELVLSARQASEISKQMGSVNVSEVLQGVAGDRLDAKLLQIAVKKWLLKKAACPVQFKWTDIGSLFWPRYIRIGSCSGSCSFPSGMHCLPARTLRMHLLRWQCKVPVPVRPRRLAKSKAPRDWRKVLPAGLNLKCAWITVPYPVTVDCMCSC